MYPSRNVIIVLIAAIALIGLVSAIKVSQSPFATVSSEGFWTRGRGQTPVADKDFFKPSENAPVTKGGAIQSTPTTPKTPAAPAVPADPVTAESYLVGDVSTGHVYIEKNQDTVLPFASMSKLITAIVATHMYSSTTTIEITEPETQVPIDGSLLRPGEHFTVHDLLYPMLLNSSNVAAEALASSTARIDFLEQMSNFAWDIGMKNSYFADPTGLSDHNQGSAADFFQLAQYLYKNRKDILDITRTVKLSVGTTTEHGSHDFTSIHPFVTDPRFIGGKTGHTPEALDTMLTILNIGGKPIAIIILRSSGGRQADTQLLVDRVSKTLAAQ